MDLKIEEIVHHRNGISGAEFDVVKFVCPEGGNMIGIVFDLDSDGYSWNGRVAVFNRDLLAEGNILFGENSWRGDHYEKDLRDAIEKKRDAEEARLLSLDPREAAMNAWDGERVPPLI